MNDTDRIRKLNDLFRTTFATGLGQVFITPAIHNLEQGKHNRVIYRVANATSFDERDGSRGFFNEGGVEYIWQIEVLDRNDHDYAAEKPWLPKKSWRRMIIMRADEW